MMTSSYLGVEKIRRGSKVSVALSGLLLFFKKQNLLTCCLCN